MYLVMKPCAEVAILCQRYPDKGWMFEAGASFCVALYVDYASLSGGNVISVSVDPKGTNELLSGSNFVCAVSDDTMYGMKGKLFSAAEWVQTYFEGPY